MTRGLRLPLPRRPDPVLDARELRTLQTILRDHIAWAEKEMDRGKVSESVIRSHMAAESALAKIEQVVQ